ncbi:diguanylate cyclase (GGDEF)-like protein [Rhodobacter sp. JA431]|uniref:GGDEF domain-containing protein n=1 Tax=Rhodobacter sp. JA431 TaxID=570013 RepID=UPI000BCFE06C|nr:GGDEF domain-containing protein [Rhodobacter sp. JA431]SOC14624.1 diguanylate cyclase (GGDEF)-like protein [Rhodobacter sp. JA431]
MDVSTHATRFTPMILILALTVIAIVLLGSAHNVILSDVMQSASLHPVSAAGYLVAALGLLLRPRLSLTLAQIMVVLVAGQRILESLFASWPILVSPDIFALWGLDLGLTGAFSTNTARALLILNGALLAERVSPRLAVGIVALGWFIAAGALFKFSFSLFNEDIHFSIFSLTALLGALTALVLRHANSAVFRVFVASGELRQPFLIMLGVIIGVPFVTGALLSHTGEFSHNHLEEMIFAFEAMEYLLLAVVFYTGATMHLQRTKLTHALHHDQLTGALNRRGLIDAIEANPRLSGMILFDLDHFKRINDSMGHIEGDRVLRAVADVVQARLAPGDVFARWGGEEFLVLLEATDHDVLEAKAEQLRRAIGGMGWATHDFPLAGVTASFGFGPYNLQAESLTAALARTDAALQTAKEGGRNHCVAAHYRQAKPEPAPAQQPQNAAPRPVLSLVQD